MQKYSKFTKVIILLFIVSAIFIVEVYLFRSSIKLNTFVWAIALGMLETIGPVLFFFFFFNAFKYCRLSSSYYKRQPFEHESYFRSLGVLVFRYVLVRSFFRYANQRVYLKGRGKAYINVFLEETKQSETSHLFALIVTMVIQVAHLSQHLFKHFWFVSLFSVMFNLYPILLQRRNRFLFESRIHDAPF